jgi:Holliday junction resolvase-like predicted endonuclease
VAGAAPIPTRTAAQQAGDAAEELVATTLMKAGWTIVARNVRVGRRELDLVAIDPGPPSALVVVEVRWRSRRDFGLPEGTVDHRKRRRIRQAAYAMVELGALQHLPHLPHLPLRFDLVAVEPGPLDGAWVTRHHRAAF